MIETLTLQNTTYTAMIGAVALLAGAAVGGVAGVISAQLTSKSQRVLERDRSEWAREDAVAKELSAAV